MVRRIVYISLFFLAFTITISVLLINHLKTNEESRELKIIDQIEDPLSDYSEGRKLFNINCAACHKIGGISDPDLLLNLESKMNKDYFNHFTRKQDSLIECGDKYQIETGSYSKLPGIAISHTFINLNRDDTDAVYEYIVAAKSR